MSEYNSIVTNWAGRAKLAGLSFLIVSLGVPWTLQLNSPVLLRSCPICVVVFFGGGLPHKNGATSEVVPKRKGYYLNSNSLSGFAQKLMKFDPCATNNTTIVRLFLFMREGEGSHSETFSCLCLKTYHTLESVSKRRS